MEEDRIVSARNNLGRTLSAQSITTINNHKRAPLVRMSSHSVRLQTPQKLSARILPDFQDNNYSPGDDSEETIDYNKKSLIREEQNDETVMIQRQFIHPTLCAQDSPTEIINKQNEQDAIHGGDFEDELNILRIQIRHLEESKKQIISKHQKGMSDLRSYYDNELDEKNRKIEQLEEEIKVTRQTVSRSISTDKGDSDRFLDRISQIETINADLEKKVNQQSIEIGRLDHELKERDVKLKKKDNEIETLNNHITSQQNELFGVKELCSTLEVQIKDVNSKKLNVEIELKDAQFRVKELNVVNDSLHKENLSIKQSVDHIERERNQLMQHMQSLTEEMNAMSSIIMQLNRDKESLTGENRKIKLDLENSQREIADLEESITLLKNQTRLAPPVYDNTKPAIAQPPGNISPRTGLNGVESNGEGKILSEREMEMAIMKYANKYFTVTQPQQPTIATPLQTPVTQTIKAHPSSPKAFKPTVARTVSLSSLTSDLADVHSNLIQNRNRVMQPSIPEQLLTTKNNASNIHSSAPFATEQTLRDTVDATADIEEQLIELSLEKTALDGEYLKLMSSNLKTIKSRKRKMEIEQRLESIARKASDLRLELKKQLSQK